MVIKSEAENIHSYHDSKWKPDAHCKICKKEIMTADQAQAEKLKILIQEFSKDADIVKIVTDIEARIATTQYHYGDYMAALSQFNKSRTMLYIMSQAMVRAGADVEGVAWAVRLLKGE